MTDSPTSLYAAWFKALPEALRAMLPAASADASQSATTDSVSAALPFPTDQVGKALNVLDGMLTQLYQAYLPLLAQGNLTADSLKAIAGAGTEMFNRALAAASATAAGAMPALANVNGLAQLAQPWSSLLAGLAPGGLGSPAGADALQTGLDRAFGGLGEAFGLGPMRELDQVCRKLMQADIAKRRAQLEYFAVVAEAFNEGTQRLLQDLDAMGRRGERIESLIAFIRLWAKAVDGPLHDAMQSERGLAITAKVIRASSQHRQQVQTAVALASEALHVPTRADIDLAYQEIQELKRELRQIKKSLPNALPKKLNQTGKQEA